MCFETLKSKKRKYFLYVLIMGVVLLLPLVLSITFGKYQTKESIKLVEGNISYKPYDFKIMAMYQENDNGEYEEIETMPTGSYIINEEKSYCTLDNINKDNNAILKTNTNGEHVINNLSKNDKCYLYFDKKLTANKVILANKTINTRTDFSVTLTTDTTGTIYSAEDDYGTSYYYAGAPTDNWIKFAGFYWRIIRINGDGTIRMIYQGTTANTTGEATQIGTSVFNSNYNNNMYVGYMYTSGQAHGNGTSSTIKNILDSWYTNNLTEYASYIATGGGATFCNDRTIYNNSSEIVYSAAGRLSANKLPSFKCADSGDRFSSSIGLITADEAAYAGGITYTKNSNYYLNTLQVYWTMSPNSFGNNMPYLLRIGSDGAIADNDVTYVLGIRPVINLKADITLTGDGTSKNPYVVS